MWTNLESFALSRLINGSAQGTTAFTYQGRLMDGGGLVNGNYELRFGLYDAATNGTSIGSPTGLTLAPVGVTNGLFTVALDFGSAAFAGSVRWLEIAVRTNGSASPHTVLSPRQLITPAPYALYAPTAGTASTASTATSAIVANGVAANSVTGAGIQDGTIAAAKLADGAVSSLKVADNAVSTAKLQDGSVNNLKLASSAVTAAKIASSQVVKSLNSLKDDVTLTAGANVTLTPSGNTIQISANTGTGGTGWGLSGNAGTTPGTHYLGTTDDRALELRVNGIRALRLEPTANDADHSNIVNVVGGSPGNYVGAGVYGATIAGGGASNWLGSAYINRVAADFGSIVGGGDNTIQSGATASTIAGGHRNVTAGGYSFIGGGVLNQILDDGYNNVIGGGGENIIGFTFLGGATISGGEANHINSGDLAAIGGGFANSANGSYATVPGGTENSASGDYSFAAGRQAKANHQGAFVWADGTIAEDFASTANNQFLIRASGGVGIGTTTPGKRLDVAVSAIGDGVNVKGTAPAYYLNNGASERAALGLAGGPTQYSTDAAAGDVVLRETTGTRRLLLQNGVGASAVCVTNNIVPSPSGRRFFRLSKPLGIEITTCPTNITAPGLYILARDCPVTTGSGIIIQASNVTLDLKGHTLSGPVSNASDCDADPGRGSIGIQVVGSNVRVNGGTVKGFGFGIVLANAHDNDLSGLTVTGNCGGIFVVSSDDNDINGNNFSENFHDGVFLHHGSTRNHFTSNVVNGNGGVGGISRGGGFYLTASDGNDISSNEISGNQRYGMLLGSSNNTVQTNTINATIAGPGIRAYLAGNNNRFLGNTANSNAGEAFDIYTTGNEVRGNTANSNGVGISISVGSGNVIESNTALGNRSFDLRDMNLPAPCTINTWTRNTFGTDNETGPNAGPGAGCIQ